MDIKSVKFNESLEAKIYEIFYTFSIPSHVMCRKALIIVMFLRVTRPAPLCKVFTTVLILAEPIAPVVSKKPQVQFALGVFYGLAQATKS